MGFFNNIFSVAESDAIGEIPQGDAPNENDYGQLAASIQYALDRGSGLFDVLNSQDIKASAAIEIAASYRCIALISGSIGRLPAYIEGPDGYKINDYRSITDRKYKALAALLFDGRRIGGLYFLANLLKQMASDMTVYGNAYLLKYPENTTNITDLEYTPAWGVSTHIERGLTSPVQLFYQMQRLDIQGRQQIASNNVIHAMLPNMGGVSNDNYLGTSPLRAIARSVGLTKSAEEFINEYFQSGGFGNQGIISLPKNIENKQAIEVENRIHRKIGRDGVKRRTFTVIGGDAKVIPMTVDTQSSAMAAIQQTLTENIARAYGIPGSLVGIKTTEVGTGLEELTKIFVRFSLAHYREAIENAISNSLFGNVYRFKLDISAFSAADLKSLSTFITATVGDAQRPPIMSRQELRDLVDVPQLEELEEWEPPQPTQPMNDPEGESDE